VDTEAAAGVRTALDLYEVAETLVRQRLRRERPGASEDEIEQQVGAWRVARPGAEDGDAPGRRRPLPR
jgi:hypothetical protein